MYLIRTKVCNILMSWRRAHLQSYFSLSYLYIYTYNAPSKFKGSVASLPYYWALFLKVVITMAKCGTGKKCGGKKGGKKKGGKKPC
jgi:hypothetical protein